MNSFYKARILASGRLTVKYLNLVDTFMIRTLRFQNIELIYPKHFSSVHVYILKMRLLA